MKKIFLITIAILLLISTFLSITSCSISKKETGSLVGVITAVETGHLYIKPVNDNGSSHLLKINISSDTSYASASQDPMQDSLADIPELHIRATVEIDYTYNPSAFEITANSIRTVDDNTPTFNWIPLTENKLHLFNYPALSAKKSGMVFHVAKITSPKLGYIVYILQKNEGGLFNTFESYWVDIDNKSLTDELKTLFEENQIGYTIKIKKSGSSFFKGISSAYSIELIEK